MVLLLFIALLAFVYYAYNPYRFKRKLKSFPGPPPLPIIGNLNELVSTKGRLERLLSYRDKYNGDFMVYAGMKPILFLSEQESVKAILRSSVNLRKTSQYNFFKNWLRNGLTTSEGDYWRRHRKIVVQAFQYQFLNAYLKTFNSASDTLIICLQKEVGKRSFNIYSYLSLCTFDALCEIAMDSSMNVQINSESQFITNVKKMGEIIMKRIFSKSIYLQSDLLYKLTDLYKEEMKTVAMLHDYIANIIMKRKLDNQSIPVDNRNLDFMNVLLHSNINGSTLTDEEIKEEVLTIFFGGHDTTSTGITFTLYCLANNPDIQERVYQEALSIYYDDIKRHTTPNDLLEMKYLEAVIKESMRLYPPIPFYGRKLVSDVDCGNGKILPKELEVAIFAMGVHNDPNLFPDPLEFKPERFLPENSMGRSPYAFLPFSFGPRSCIGYKFALMEMKTVISKVVLNYKLLPIPDHTMELIFDSVLRSENGTLIGIEKRI